MLDGDRRSVSGATKKEVVDKLTELRSKYNHGEYAKRNDITVKEWCGFWLETKIEPNISEQSFIGLEALFRNHVYPVLGKYKLRELTKPMLEESYAKMFFQKTNQDKKYKEPNYSHSTVNALSVQMKKCLQYAVECKILASNPHIGVELHKLRPPTS